MSELVIDKKELHKLIDRSSYTIADNTEQTIDNLKKERFSKHFLERCAPFIRIQLRNIKNLPVRDGKLQFYDDETRMKKAQKGRSFKQARGAVSNMGFEDHFIHHWDVGYQTGKGGHGKLILLNDKEVYSRTKSFPLLKLLWEGTGTYVVPIPLSDAERKTLFHTGGNRRLFDVWAKNRKETTRKIKEAYKEYMKHGYRYERQKTGSKPVEKTQDQQQKEELEALNVGGRGGYYTKSGYKSKNVKFDVNIFGVAAEKGSGSYTVKGLSPGQTRFYVRKHKVLAWEDMSFEWYTHLNQPIKMSFYNRFKGKFYYNRFMRRGIEQPVVKDFHTYVTDSIVKGINDAKGTVNPEDIDDALEHLRVV